MVHGPRKKPLDFGGNPDRVTLCYDEVYSYVAASPSLVGMDLCYQAFIWI